MKHSFVPFVSFSALVALACGGAPEGIESSELEGAELDTIDLDDVGEAGTAAQELSGPRLAFAWAHLPDRNHAALAPWSFNSEGGSVAVERTGAGEYLVRFDLLGEGGGLTLTGSPQVVAYGSTSDRCTMSGLGTAGDDLLIGVQCRNRFGAPVDTFFVASYDETLRGRPDSAFAACVRGDASHTPPAATTWNPSGRGARVTRDGAGLYTMTFPGLASFRGVPAVTPMGPLDRMCQVVNYTQDGSDTNIRIACFTNAGAPADAIFAVKYVGRGGASSLPFDMAFAWAHDTVSALYVPSTSFSWNNVFESSTVNRAGNTATGQFFTFPGFPVADDAHRSTAMVTGYGPAGTPVHCKPLGWHGERLDVACFRPNGVRVASRHLAHFVNVPD